MTILAALCAGGVATVCVLRARRRSGYRAAVYFAVGGVSALAALVNLSVLAAGEAAFVRAATIAYVGFATALFLPLARALGKVTYRVSPRTD